MHGLAHLTPDAVGPDEGVGVGLRPVFEGDLHAPPLAEILVLLDSRLDPHGPLGETVLHKYLLNDRSVHNYRRGKSGLEGGPDGVEPHEPIARVVQSRELVPLTVADLQPADPVGGAGARGNQLLVYRRIDLLQRPQRVRLDLNRTAVRRVRRRLLE